MKRRETFEELIPRQQNYWNFILFGIRENFSVSFDNAINTNIKASQRITSEDISARVIDNEICFQFTEDFIETPQQNKQTFHK
jgi:hypothetical protein